MKKQTQEIITHGCPVCVTCASANMRKYGLVPDTALLMPAHSEFALTQCACFCAVGLRFLKLQHTIFIVEVVHMNTLCFWTLHC